MGQDTTYCSHNFVYINLQKKLKNLEIESEDDYNPDPVFEHD